MNRLYPVFIKLEGRPTVVVGGGEVGLRKVESLLEAGARVTVVSPTLVPALLALHEAGRIAWTSREYRAGDLEGAFLAFSAADDTRTHAEVHREAEARGILFNAVDDDPHCVFHVPAVAVRGELKIAVSTGGRSPALGARLRDRLAAAVDEPSLKLLDLLGDLRPRILERYAADPERRRRILVALAAAVRPAAAPPTAEVERTADVERAARGPEERGEPASVPEAARAGAVPPPVERGKVYLVGAGPGDPGLLTLRAAQVLAAADEVHYDRLVGPGVLERIPPSAVRVFVGKEVGVADRPDTGALLAAAARAGKAVVRLKGGDPCIFGRGGEEMLALLKAGVPFELVPGVSSLNAAPAAASIPLTCRGMAWELVVRSGYRREEILQGGAASVQGTTYVYLMTLGRLPEIVEDLRREGLDPDTPAAVIQRATLPDQRVVLGTLENLASRAARAGLRPPALVVAGEVVRFARWKEFLPFLEAHVLEAHDWKEP